jgi:hypothetical protein
MSILLRARVREANRQSGTRVDREAGVIYGVKVLGRKSRNGREYTDAAWDSAVRILEGAMVNIDHDAGKDKLGRRVSSRFGKLVKLRKEADGVYADLHYLRSHPMAEQVLEAAERMPEVLGLSQDATVAGERRGDGTLLVHEVLAVRSVDVVADPATVTSLFESEAFMNETPEQANAQPAPVGGPLPMSVEAAFLALQNAVMASDDFDDTERLAVLKDVMKLKGKVLGDGEEEAGEGEEEDDDEVPESRARGGANTPASTPASGLPKGTRQRLRFLEIKDRVRDAGLVPEQDLVESLVGLPDERIAQHLAYLQRLQQPAKSRPRSAGRAGPFEARKALRAQESAERQAQPTRGAGPPPLDDVDKLAQWCQANG